MYKKNEKLSRHYKANKTANSKKRTPMQYDDESIKRILQKSNLAETSNGYFVVKSRV